LSTGGFIYTLSPLLISRIKDAFCMRREHYGFIFIKIRIFIGRFLACLYGYAFLNGLRKSKSKFLKKLLHIVKNNL